MLPIYVCDDNYAYRSILTNAITQTIKENKYNMEVVCSTNLPKELLNHLKGHNERSLYFLDLCIQKSPTDGYRLANMIRKYDPRGYVVVITSHDNYKDLSFRHRAELLDYITKGKDNINERIRACLEEVDAKIKHGDLRRDTEEEIEIRTKSDYVRFRKQDVYYARRLGRETKVEGPALRYTANATLEEIKDQFDDSFCQCHRSYIVNLDHVVGVNKSKIVLDNGEELPVARNKASELQTLLE